MTKEEALVHFLNDEEYKMVRLWAEIFYTLQEGHTPTRVEFAKWLLAGGGVESFWTQGLRQRHG